MPKAITVLNLFDTFASREQYEKATGEECPTWDEKKPPKNWRDKGAKKSMTVNGKDFTVYSNAVVTGFADGALVRDTLGIETAEAKVVNIPQTGMANIPGAAALPVPVPMRELLDNEVPKQAFGGVIQIWTAEELATADVSFSQADRTKLEQILAGVNTLLAK